MADVKEQVKEIKQSFRLMMDGYVANSMREKGVQYKLNWGATLPRLREAAETYGKNYDLAIALWKEMTGAEYTFCHADAVVLKTMIRSNPGLMLLRDGKVVGKWPSTALPRPDEIDTSK